MKEKIIGVIAAIIIILIGVSVIIFTAPTVGGETSDPVATISEDYIPSETTPTEEEVIILDTVVVERVEPTTYEEANILLEKAIANQELANQIYANLISLGYADGHPAVIMAKTDIENRDNEIIYYQQQFLIFEERHKWDVRSAEYPVATQAWLYMKNEFGWSDTVCAGILGNMMAECGGCWSSDLNWSVNSSSGYGMIQWLGSRRNLLFSIYPDYY
jgi:hypothetical protein